MTTPTPTPDAPQPPVRRQLGYDVPHTAADDPRRGGLAVGVILVVLGLTFLAVRVLAVQLAASSWPLWIIVPGLAMFVASFLVRSRGGLGLAIPGAILATVGAVLWVQETYGLYATWAYAWALVAPTAPGLAVLVYGLYLGDRHLASDGARTTLIGLGLFASFGLFFEGAVGLSGNRLVGLDGVFPVLVIGLGVLLVVLSIGRRRPDRTP